MVRHLPPRIKQVLTSQHLDAYLSPPVTRLNHLFQKTYTDATLKGAETGWLILTVRIASATSMLALSMQTNSIRLAHC